MRLTARVEVNLNLKAVKAAGQGFGREFADKLGKRTAELAAENVAPGEGPGPHPHISEHEDSGDLRRSLKVEPESRGFLETTRVYTILPYGAHLEYGFHTRSGRLVRYPWLMPAMMQAAQEAGDIARSTARRWLSDEGAPYKGRVNLEAPLSATLPITGGRLE